MVRAAIEECKVALQFLTRLPAGAPARSAPPLAASAPMFPLIGALIGAAGGLVFALAAGLGLPPMLAALLAVAAQVLLTGGLHEDGLADIADGFGGGRTRADKLRILRDSRIGSFGAMALMLALLARIGALAALASPALVAAALIAAGAASRAALPVIMVSIAPARDEGLAVAAGRPHPLRAAAGAAIAILASPDPAATRHGDGRRDRRRRRRARHRQPRPPPDRRPYRRCPGRRPATRRDRLSASDAGASPATLNSRC